MRRSALALGLLLMSPSAIEAKASADIWAEAFDGPCSNCSERSAETGLFADIKLPRHAITSLFVGEFATVLELCVIDLDSGSIGCHRRKAAFSPVPQAPIGEGDRTGHLEPALLDAIRTEALDLWKAHLHAHDMGKFFLFPGCGEDRAIVSGDRQLNYGEMGFESDVNAGRELRKLVSRAREENR